MYKLLFAILGSCREIFRFGSYRILVAFWLMCASVLVNSYSSHLVDHRPENEAHQQFLRRPGHVHFLVLEVTHAKMITTCLLLPKPPVGLIDGTVRSNN